MATKDVVTKVWIEEGCIVCDACETSAPTVFHVTDDTCIIRPEALNAEFTKPLTDSIVEAAEECPVDVIKFETASEEVAEGAAAEAAAPTAPAAAAEKAGAKAAKESAEPSAAAKSKSPEPAEKRAKEGATKSADKAPKSPEKAAAKSPDKVAAKAPSVSVAGDPDPAIQALLRAATARGGVATLSKSEEGMTPAVKAWEKKSASELPPDARQAKVLAATKTAREKEGVTRRGILAGSACGIGWLSVAGTTAVSGLAFQRFMMPNVLEEPDPRVRIGTLDKFRAMATGDVNVETKPLGFWIIRVEDKIVALNIVCTHLGCIPSWLPNDRKFKCPCHGSGFRQSGINFEGPAPRPLERFRISVVDGVVVVDRSKKFQYEKGEWDNPESYVSV